MKTNLEEQLKLIQDLNDKVLQKLHRIESRLSSNSNNIDPLDELIVTKARTFDDILLLPFHSKVLPTMTSQKSQFTKNISLNIPFISAAMDTVTESEMAIAMAKVGGIGIIHKNMRISDQVEQVRQVKDYGSKSIQDTIAVLPGTPIEEIDELFKEIEFSSIPVITEQSRVLGVISRQDLEFADKSSKCAKDIMTENFAVAKEGISNEDAIKLLYDKGVKILFLTDEFGDLSKITTMKRLSKKKSNKLESRNIQGNLLVGAAVGVGDAGVKRAKQLIKAGVDVLCIDSAHGDSAGVVETLKDIRMLIDSDWNTGHSVDIIAGNVATPEGCENLIKAGADAVKVGIGPGSICTTRVVTGIGVPQVHAVYTCAKIAKKYGIPVIADGGITYSGDCAKVLACGANSVMMGSVLAGSSESPGKIIHVGGKKYKEYRGMGSIGAMDQGSKDRYFQDGINSDKLVPEGVEARVEYKDSVKDILHQFVGGLKSSMGYLGAQDISTFQKNAQFVEISSAGYVESHVHGVAITNEPANYKSR